MIKILEKRKLSDFEYYVKLSYEGREYATNFSLPGLKLNLKKYDKKSLNYVIANAMINAVTKKAVTTEEETNGSQDY